MNWRSKSLQHLSASDAAKSPRVTENAFLTASGSYEPAGLAPKIPPRPTAKTRSRFSQHKLSPHMKPGHGHTNVDTSNFAGFGAGSVDSRSPKLKTAPQLSYAPDISEGSYHTSPHAGVGSPHYLRSHHVPGSNPPSSQHWWRRSTPQPVSARAGEAGSLGPGGRVSDGMRAAPTAHRHSLVPQCRGDPDVVRRVDKYSSPTARGPKASLNSVAPCSAPRTGSRYTGEPAGGNQLNITVPCSVACSNDYTTSGGVASTHVIDTKKGQNVVELSPRGGVRGNSGSAPQGRLKKAGDCEQQQSQHPRGHCSDSVGTPIPKHPPPPTQIPPTRPPAPIPRAQKLKVAQPPSSPSTAASTPSQYQSLEEKKEPLSFSSPPPSNTASPAATTAKNRGEGTGKYSSASNTVTEKGRGKEEEEEEEYGVYSYVDLIKNRNWWMPSVGKLRTADGKTLVAPCG